MLRAALPGTHPATPKGAVGLAAVAPPCTICSLSAWLILASMASARESGSCEGVGVGVGVGVGEDEPPPHPDSAAAMITTVKPADSCLKQERKEKDVAVLPGIKHLALDRNSP